MSTCRSCGADIAWVMLRSGKQMPVEGAEPEEYRVWTKPPEGTEELRVLGRPLRTDRRGVYRPIVLVTEAGDVVRAWQGWIDDGRPGDQRVPLDGPCRIVGYESHFATCPHGPGWRRG